MIRKKKKRKVAKEKKKKGDKNIPGTITPRDIFIPGGKKKKMLADTLTLGEYYLTNREPKCIKPIILKNGQKVNCGKCELCIDRKRKDWLIRNKLELGQNKTAMFITLTFDNAHLKDTSYTQIQLFLKRLRKYIQLNTSYKYIKYFGAYENGDRTGRPHYHIIIFGAWIPPKGKKTTNDIICNIWGNGFTDTKLATPETISYITSYIYKQENPQTLFCNEKCYNQYNKYNTSHIRRNSFIFMSKGIGYNWLTSNLDTLLNKPFITTQGYKIAIPKSFKQKIKELTLTETQENGTGEVCNDYFVKYIDKHPTNAITSEYIANYTEWLYNQMKAQNENLKLKRRK